MSDRRVYTEEYKREAVRLAKDSGNLSGTARSLGVNPTVLQRWKKAVQDDKPHAFPGQGNPADPELARLRRENTRLQEENGILKKAGGYLHQPSAVRYHFIQEQRDAFALAALCRAMQVSVSGFYAWRKRPPSVQEQQNAVLSAQITTAHL